MVGIYPTYLEKTMKTGIKETKELLRFVFSLANAVKESLSDGDLSLWDAKKFIEPLTLLVDALDNIDQILPELQDFDEDEISELVTFMMTELGVKIKIPEIPNPPAELEVAREHITQALDTGKSILQLVNLVKG